MDSRIKRKEVVVESNSNAPQIEQGRGNGEKNVSVDGYRKPQSIQQWQYEQ